jgi:hypothetical protein
VPQACELTQLTVLICAYKTDQNPADMQAMYEHYRENGKKQYIVFDYTVEGGYAPWVHMNEDLFNRTFRYAFEPANPNKFEPVVTI